MYIHIRVTHSLQIQENRFEISQGRGLEQNCLTDDLQAGIHEHQKTKTTRQGQQKKDIMNTLYTPDLSTPVSRPLYMTAIEAGFPSPADDYIEGRLDLNQHLIKHPAATFFVKVSGHSMIDAGIFPEDILIVDRSLEAVDKKIVIAVVNGELTVKRLRIRSGRPVLEPENDQYASIEITPDMAFEIWGVVTSVIHKV